MGMFWLKFMLRPTMFLEEGGIIISLFLQLGSLYISLVRIWFFSAHLVQRPVGMGFYLLLSWSFQSSIVLILVLFTLGVIVFLWL